MFSTLKSLLAQFGENSKASGSVDISDNILV